MDFSDPASRQLQVATHVADRSTVPDLVELAALAHRKGFSRIWINDNLGYRHVFTVLAAIASSVPIGIGTAVAVPYYRNPVDLADTVASLTELTPGREVCLGLGRGSLAQTGVEIETPAPYAVLAETAACVEALLAGEEIRFGDFEHLTSVFGLRPEASMHLRFEPQAPVRTYLGGYGPTAMRTAGQSMDGVLLGGWFLPLLKAGKVEAIVSRAEQAAREAGRALRVLAGLNVSVAEDEAAALAFGRTHVAHAIVTLNRQLSRAEIASIGVDPTRVDRLEAAFRDGATVQEATALVTDAMVEAFFVVGDADGCAAQLRALETQYDPSVDAVVFGKLGPDLEAATAMLADEVLPAL